MLLSCTCLLKKLKGTLISRFWGTLILDKATWSGIHLANVWHQEGVFAPGPQVETTPPGQGVYWVYCEDKAICPGPAGPTGWGCTEVFCLSRHWRSRSDIIRVRHKSTVQLQFISARMLLGHRAESVVCAELCGHQVPSSEAVFVVFLSGLCKAGVRLTTSLMDPNGNCPINHSKMNGPMLD